MIEYLGKKTPSDSTGKNQTRTGASAISESYRKNEELFVFLLDD